jgi:hypothetical protein
MTATKTFGLWRSFLGLYRGSRWILLLSVLLSATQIVFLLSIAYFVGQIFDRVLPEVDILRLREIAFLILAAMALNSLAAIGAKRLSIRHRSTCGNPCWLIVTASPDPFTRTPTRPSCMSSSFRTATAWTTWVMP